MDLWKKWDQYDAMVGIGLHSLYAIYVALWGNIYFYVFDAVRINTSVQFTKNAFISIRNLITRIKWSYVMEIHIEYHKK